MNAPGETPEAPMSSGIVGYWRVSGKGDAIIGLRFRRPSGSIKKVMGRSPKAPPHHFTKARALCPGKEDPSG